MQEFLLFVNIVGSAAVVLLGFKLISESFQKFFARFLLKLATKAERGNIWAVLSGFGIGAGMQSPSAASVLLVSFVSAGVYTFAQSLCAAFGINLAASLTGWIIAFLGFNPSVSLFALAVIGVGFFSQLIKKWEFVRRAGKFILGIGIIVFGLNIMGSLVPYVSLNAELNEFAARFSPNLLHTRVMLVLIGTVLTVLLQSSNAALALIIVFAAKGCLINYQSACALVVGVCVGSTLSANLAALSAPLKAKRAATGHLLFNLIGALWVIVLFGPFTALAGFFITGDPNAGGFKTALHIASFHTLYVLVNTILMLCLVKWLERFIIWLKPQEKADANVSDLLYLSVPFADNGDLAAIPAVKQTQELACLALNLFGQALEIYTERKRNLSVLCEKISQEKDCMDILHGKINRYLTNLVHGRLTRVTREFIFSLFEIAGHLQSIGHYCERTGRLYSKVSDGETGLPVADVNALKALAQRTQTVLSQTCEILKKGEGYTFKNTALINEEASEMRYDFKILRDIKTEAAGALDIDSGPLYYDLLSCYEKISYHCFSITAIISRL